MDNPVAEVDAARRCVSFIVQRFATSRRTMWSKQTLLVEMQRLETRYTYKLLGLPELQKEPEDAQVS